MVSTRAKKPTGKQSRVATKRKTTTKKLKPNKSKTKSKSKKSKTETFPYSRLQTGRTYKRRACTKKSN